MYALIWAVRGICDARVVDSAQKSLQKEGIDGFDTNHLLCYASFIYGSKCSHENDGHPVIQHLQTFDVNGAELQRWWCQERNAICHDLCMHYSFCDVVKVHLICTMMCPAARWQTLERFATASFRCQTSSGIAVQPRVYSRFLSAPAGTESIGPLDCCLHRLRKKATQP